MQRLEREKKKTSKHEKLIHSGRNGGDGKEDVEEKRSKMLLLRAALVQVYNNTMISSEWVSEWVSESYGPSVCVRVVYYLLKMKHNTAWSRMMDES